MKYTTLMAFVFVGILASCSEEPVGPQVGRLRATLDEHESTVTSVAFSPDGTTLASASFDSTIRLWEMISPQLAFNRNQDSLLGGGGPLRGHKGAVWSVSFSPDGNFLASGSDDETIRLWEVGTGQHSGTLTGHTDWVRSVAFSPDGTTLASGSDDGTIRLWDIMLP